MMAADPPKKPTLWMLGIACRTKQPPRQKGHTFSFFEGRAAIKINWTSKPISPVYKQ
jgi:hypothetical protein